METLTNYRQSQDLLKLFLPTRKKNNGYIFGDLKLAGLFHIDDYIKDRRYFRWAMVGEAIGVIAMLFFSGANIFFIGGMVGVIFIDLFAAYLVHLKVGDICLEKNQLKLLQLEQVYEPKRSPDLNSLIVSYEKSIQKLTNWGWALFAKGLIWFVCLLKIALIVILLSGINAWVLVMAFVYITVALVHIYKTGYFLAGFNYRRLFKKEKGNYLKEIKEKHGALGANVNNSVKQFDDIYCEMHIDIKDDIIADIINSQPHIFLNSFNSDNVPKEHNVTYDNKSEKFVLKTWGVIDDDTLFLLSSGGNSQTPIRQNLSKSLIAYLGLRMQLEKYL